MTILVSTPYMDEADRCDRVALMQGGRLLAVDTPQAIAQSFDRPLLAVRAARRYPALLALRESPHVHAVYPFGDTLHYVDARTGEPPRRSPSELRAFLASRGFADATRRAGSRRPSRTASSRGWARRKARARHERRARDRRPGL